jgi:thiol:disulfide interchange protein DsbA
LAKRDKKIANVRNGIIIGVAVLAAVVLGYGTLYSTVPVGEFAEGDSYRLIEEPPRRRPGAPIVVREFFSYGCIHCKNFDPLIESWQADLPAHARFERAPVAFSQGWALLAQTYLTLEHLDALDPNHGRLLNAIHDSGRQFRSIEEVADFVDGNGIDREEFIKAFSSPPVQRRMRQIDTDSRTFTIGSVPTLVVADKYVVNMDVGRKRSLAVADYLIALEHGEAPPEG